MTVKEIVRKYLEENGFDGLCYSGECACINDDLMPCDDNCIGCEAGYVIDCPEECGEHDWHIGPKP
jgi:hypothetical protein